MALSASDRRAKLVELAAIEGYGDPDELIAAIVHDSVSPGICSRVGCSYTTEVEPDQHRGWCEACGTATVDSALVLAELI